MIQCPYCNRTFSSNGSYRVHKHRYHSGLEYKQPVAKNEEVQQPVQEERRSEEQDIITEDIYTPLKINHNRSTSEPQSNQPESQEPEHRDPDVVERGKGGDDGLAIIGGLGAIAVVIILALLGKK